MSAVTRSLEEGFNLTKAEATGQTAECEDCWWNKQEKVSCRHMNDVLREKYLWCSDKYKYIHPNQLTWLSLSELLSRETKEKPKEPPGFLCDKFFLLKDTGIF